jgi:ABC-type phosphate transport system substrate-binding protein
MKQLHSALLAALLVALSNVAFADGVVVVGANSPISSADADSLRQVFLGKSSSIGGSAVTPVDQDAGSSIRADFYQAVASMQPNQVKSYWAKQVFTGKGTPPDDVGGNPEVIAAIASDPSAIGYVSRDAVTDDVRVVFEF